MSAVDLSLPISQNPIGSSSYNRSSSKVLAFDLKEILKLIELGEVLSEMSRGILCGVTKNGLIGRHGTKTNGVNLNRSSNEFDV